MTQIHLYAIGLVDTTAIKEVHQRFQFTNATRIGVTQLINPDGDILGEFTSEVSWHTSPDELSFDTYLHEEIKLAVIEKRDTSAVHAIHNAVAL